MTLISASEEQGRKQIFWIHVHGRSRVCIFLPVVSSTHQIGRYVRGKKRAFVPDDYMAFSYHRVAKDKPRTAIVGQVRKTASSLQYRFVPLPDIEDPENFDPESYVDKFTAEEYPFCKSPDAAISRVLPNHNKPNGLEAFGFLSDIVQKAIRDKYRDLLPEINEEDFEEEEPSKSKKIETMEKVQPSASGKISVRDSRGQRDGNHKKLRSAHDAPKSMTGFDGLKYLSSCAAMASLSSDERESSSEKLVNDVHLNKQSIMSQTGSNMQSLPTFQTPAGGGGFWPAGAWFAQNLLSSASPMHPQFLGQWTSARNDFDGGLANHYRNQGLPLMNGMYAGPMLMPHPSLGLMNPLATPIPSNGGFGGVMQTASTTRSKSL
jgi:hypothetical protein